MLVNKSLVSSTYSICRCKLGDETSTIVDEYSLPYTATMHFDLFA